MKKIIKGISIITLVLFYTNGIAQIKNAKTETVKIYGNCDMCKNTIEKAGNKKKVSKVDWNKDTKIATLVFNSKTTSEDEILKRIALSGYDNEKYLAPDDAFAKLPECCKYERKKPSTAKITPELKNETSVQDTIKKQVISPLLEVYTTYFALKDALVINDGVMASNKAKELFKAIDKTSMDKMNSAQHTVWMKYMDKLSYDAEHIKGVTETEHQREHFNSLSKNMFEVMKVIKPSYQVYFDHCPMYNDGKGGDWISKEAVIKNPFYGSQMMSCGKTVETIK
jgi:copper chaperone CopZ